VDFSVPIREADAAGIIMAICRNINKFSGSTCIFHVNTERPIVNTIFTLVNEGEYPGGVADP